MFGILLSSKRLGEIDALRAIAIIFVIVIHTCNIFGKYDAIKHFGVPIFIFISGLVLTYRYRNISLLNIHPILLVLLLGVYWLWLSMPIPAGWRWYLFVCPFLGVRWAIFIFPVFVFIFTKRFSSLNIFFRKRISYVIIPYLIWSAAIFLSRGRFVDIGTYFDAVTHGKMLTLWFIYVIFQLYLLFPMLIEIYKRLSKLCQGVVVICMFIITLFSYVTWKQYLSYSLCQHIDAWMFYFVLGMYIGYNWEDVSKLFKRIEKFKFVVCVIYGTLLIVSTSLLTDSWWFSVMASRDYIGPYTLIGTVITIFVLLFIFTNAKGWIKPLRILGVFSTGIFLVHRPVQFLIGDFIPCPYKFIILSLISICLVLLLWELPFSDYIIGRKVPWKDTE